MRSLRSVNPFVLSAWGALAVVLPLLLAALLRDALALPTWNRVPLLLLVSDSGESVLHVLLPDVNACAVRELFLFVLLSENVYAVFDNYHVGGVAPAAVVPLVKYHKHDQAYKSNKYFYSPCSFAR